MLVLTVQKGEHIKIGPTIKVTYLGSEGKRGRIGIDAPTTLLVELKTKGKGRDHE